MISNKEEYDKILEIIDADQYSGEKEFVESCAKKFNTTRNLFYLITVVLLFVMMHKDKLFPESFLLTMAICLITLVITRMYFKQRKIFHQEINMYLFRECYPDKGLSRYLQFIPIMLKKEMLWSKVHYNMGIGLYYLGKISQASSMLGLMEESCTTANDMILALHLKQLIAMYYMDLDTAISCANDAGTLYPKATHAGWTWKVYNDIQTTGAYAGYYKSNDLQQIYSVLGKAQIRPLDEVIRHYYLYLAAKANNDPENAETYRQFVKDNAGTTWYGQAVDQVFMPEDKPENYPGYTVCEERLHAPAKVDSTRIKYLLIGVLIVALVYFVPQLLYLWLK